MGACPLEHSAGIGPSTAPHMAPVDLGFRPFSLSTVVYFSTHWGHTLPPCPYTLSSLSWYKPGALGTESGSCLLLHTILVTCTISPQRHHKTPPTPVLSFQGFVTPPCLPGQSADHAHPHWQIPSIFSIAETRDGQGTTREQQGQPLC